MTLKINKIHNKQLFFCPVCGYDKFTEPPYDADGNPSHEICSCCGFEFGFDDFSEGISFEEYRKKWIDSGFHFFNKSMQPPDWNYQQMQKQLKHVK